MYKLAIVGATGLVGRTVLKILEDKNIKISKIATGIPMGTDMEYIDSLTLELAIDERKKVN